MKSKEKNEEKKRKKQRAAKKQSEVEEDIIKVQVGAKGGSSQVNDKGFLVV